MVAFGSRTALLSQHAAAHTCPSCVLWYSLRSTPTGDQTHTTTSQTHMRARISTYTHTHRHTDIDKTQTYTHAHVHPQHIHTRIRGYSMRAYAHVCACMHTCTHAHVTPSTASGLQELTEKNVLTSDGRWLLVSCLGYIVGVVT